MLIDSHCHLPHKKYGKSVLEIITDAKKEGIEKIITIGTSTKDNQIAIDTAQKFDGIFATVGIYPHEDRNKDINNLRKHLATLLGRTPHETSKQDDNYIVGIGECGIDITNRKNQRPLKKQIALFEMQIELAIVHNLPIVIHNRSGDKEVIEILKKYKSKNLRGVIHCFSSSWEFAQKVLGFGFYLSFSGTITYPSGKNLLETVKKVPLDKFLVETDSPYLAPQRHRGQTNEPKYVKIVAEEIAKIKELPIKTICTCSYKNTCALFTL